MNAPDLAPPKDSPSPPPGFVAATRRITVSTSPSRVLATEGFMDRTEHFRGKLWAGDHVLMEHVEGHLKTKVKPNSVNGEWSGHFNFPPEIREHFVDGARYRLTLIDGR